jgi:hypothetical protein
MNKRRFDERDEIGEDTGDDVYTSFNAERMCGGYGRNNQDIPTVDDLKVGIVRYLNEIQPELPA